MHSCAQLFKSYYQQNYERVTSNITSILWKDLVMYVTIGHSEIAASGMSALALTLTLAWTSLPALRKFYFCFIKFYFEKNTSFVSSTP